MRIFIIDPNPETREALNARVNEALRQAGLRRVEVMSGEFELLELQSAMEAPALTFLGPGCYPDVEESISQFRTYHPTAQAALVLENETYAREAVELRRLVSIRMMPIADIAQIAQVILDCEGRLAAQPGARSQGVIAVAQFKGGVGSTTLACALAACWARHSLSVALVDFDDINPQVTDWGRVQTPQRLAVSEMLREGEVPKYRLNELLNQVEGYDGRLTVIGQPEDYRDGFHFKADILENAPSSAEFVRSLISVLQEEFDVIVIDLGRSWGISTFAALPLCQHVLLVTDDDGYSLRRTLQSLRRLYRESDDPDEFDLAHWRVVLNGFTGKLLAPKDVADEIQALDIFPEAVRLHTVPFSRRGRQWGAPGQSFYEAAEDPVKAVIGEIAFGLVPFRQQQSPAIYGKLRQLLKF